MVFFLITLLPQINLGINILTSEGERYLYLPNLGLSLIVAALLFSLKQKTIRLILTSLLLLASISLLIIRLCHWREASDYTKKVMAQFAPYVQDSHSWQQIFIGLPDNYQGAFIFRNGFNEALKLSYPTFQASPQIIPVASFLVGQEINWLYREGEIIGHSSELTFLPINSVPVFDYKLINEQTIEARYHFNLAAGYILKLNQKFINSTRGHQLEFFAFDENGLLFLGRETKN